jgi:hypothetical protein
MDVDHHSVGLACGRKRGFNTSQMKASHVATIACFSTSFGSSGRTVRVLGIQRLARGIFSKLFSPVFEFGSRTPATAGCRIASRQSFCHRAMA